MKLISYGGGVNSTAMIIYLFEKGIFYPVVFSDPGSEHPETYAYLLYFKTWIYKKYKILIQTISPYTHKELFSGPIRETQAKSLKEFCLKKGKIPFGGGAKWCSTDWKRDPILRWGKKRGIKTHLIGFTIDESHRMGDNNGRYSREYPLIEADINRADCIKIIKAAGLEIPSKSGCYFCPYQKLSEWKLLNKRHGDLFEKASNMEESASCIIGRKVTMRPDDYSLADMQEIWKEENPLFPELQDYSHMDCYMCHL